METLNSFNLVSVAVRLLLAMVSGGLIGYGRSKKSAVQASVPTC